LQVPIPGGPSRKSPELRNRALDQAERMQTRPQAEGREQAVDRTQPVDRIRFSAELTDEVNKAGDPTGNVDQLIVAMQGMAESRHNSRGQKPLEEVGAAGGIKGNQKKRSPRVERAQQQRNSVTRTGGGPSRSTAGDPGTTEPPKGPDRVDLGAQSQALA
jgi:hypothetical protein